MKKYLVFGMMSAIALSFTACSSEDEVAQVNPNVENEAVMTKFSISLPKAATTRMAAGDAQEDEVFSGMKDMTLYPFAVADAVAGTSAMAFDAISLGALANEAAFTESGTNHMSKVYDVAVPLGVKTFLFYASKTSTTGGALTATFPAAKGGTPADGINFALVPIQEKGIADMAADAEGTKVLAALNAVEAALVADPMLDGIRLAFETNTAGAAASVKALLEDVSASLAAINATDAKTAVDAEAAKLGNFPANIGLPDGAVSVAFTPAAAEGAAGTFAFALNDNKGLGSPALETYTKPAELYYYVNTPINVSTTVHKEQYAAQANWADVLALYETAKGTVTNTTAGIALVNPIQYGVAQLESTVKLADGDIKDQEGTVITPDFDVNGILVLSQKNVDWQFKPTGTASYVVYDPTQTGSNVTVATTATDPNYTLVLESAEDELQVAVELVNNGADFVGYNGEIIPTGTKFYLVGKLTKPGTGTSEATEIFQQDFKTIVNFTIGATSLTNAYNTIPDLRTPQLELGLTVDLKWQPGMTFDVEF